MTSTGSAAEGEGHQPGGRVVGLWSSNDRAAHLGASGALPVLPALNPAGLDLLQVCPARPVAVAGVEDADLHLPRRGNLLSCSVSRARGFVGTSLSGNGASARLEAVDRHPAQHQHEHHEREPVVSLRRVSGSALDDVDAGVQDVALLEGGPQRAVQPVLEVEVVAPLDHVREQVAEERGVLVEQGGELQGVLGGHQLLEAHRRGGSAAQSRASGRGRGRAARRPRA